MANKNGVVSIGLNVDYQKSLQEMTKAFTSELTKLSNAAQKLKFSKDLTDQIGAVSAKVDGVTEEFRAMFDELNSNKLDASRFTAYQDKITKEFSKIETSISGITSQISAMDEKIGMLSGADIASGMKKQFDELKDSLLSTYQGLEKVFDLAKSSSGLSGAIDSSALKDYKATLAEVRKAQKEIDNLDFSGSSDDDLFDRLSREEEMLNKQMATYKELKAEMSATSKGSPQFSALENNLIRVQMAISKTSETIQELDSEIAVRNLGAGMEDDTQSIINSIKHFDTEIDNFVASTQKMIQANKEAQNSVEQTQTAFNTFQIKNGAIHVPVEVATKSGTLQKQLQETINKLQEYAQKNSIIAKVKLVLDGGSASGYKKNDDITKQLEDGQGEPAVDISKAIKKTYVQAVREAEKTAKDAIKAIQAIFDGSPIKITPNKEAFTAELSTMVDSSLGKIAEDTTGLKVNEELEKLVANLKEVSTSLSGNENFRLGLDEASIKRITIAIKDMADMIQRAFGVASNDDIAAQWAVIESKFKGVAGEEGKLLKGNKEHKIAIQELAVEYKKYLDMGGKNDLSALTAHKQTVKNITAEYENLGKAAQEAVQQQEKAAKKPAAKKVTSEEAEAIKSITRENKKLETQASKTSTALDNEAKSAQSAAEKFRKLAKEKGAAVVANRELAKAAKETADALTKEANARKSGAGKTNKNAAAMDGEGVEPIRLDKSEMQQYSGEVLSILNALEELSKTTYKIDLTNDGKLVIAKKEIADTGAEAKAFTVTIDRIDDILEETADGVVVSSSKIEAALNSAFDSAKISTSTKDLASKAQDAFDKFKLKNEGDSNWGDITAKVKELEDSISGIDSQGKLNKFNQDLKDLDVTLKNIGKDNKLGDILDGARTFKDINEVRANIDSLFASMGKVNEKSIRINGTNKLTAEVKAASGEIRKMNVSLDSDGFARYVDAGIVQFGRLRAAAEGVFSGIKSMVRIYLSPQDFIRYFRQGFDTVKEIDTAMTELKKVSDAPIGDIVAYFDDATESAKGLGSTVKDMISATADWSRLGYNLPDARELGEVAVLYKNVGDGIDIDTANESLVSTIQGFQLQAKDAMSVIDSFNEVSNNYAISSAGIGEALKRSAAAFNAANTDLNQSIALITAGNEIVQSPEKIGTMWQTVSARIRGTKTELEELGESTDDVLSSSKLRSLVKGYTGVDILKDKNTYKDIYTIVSEIGEKWKDLTDMQRAALLEGLAGKKQSNTLAAVLNNADRLKEIYETAEGSAGSAQREQERYAQSVQYSLDQLTAHGEEFWNTFIKKDDVKNFINLINTLISGATKLVETFGSIPTVAGILGVYGSAKNVGIFKTIKDEATGAAKGIGFLGKSTSELKGIFTSIKTKGLFNASLLSETDVKCIEKYNEAIKNNIPHQQAMKEASIGASQATKQVIANANGSTIALNTMTLGAKAATIGMNTLKAAMNAIWWMAILNLVSSAISWIGDFANAGEKAKEAANELSSELQSQKETIEGNISTIKGLDEEFKRLSKGVDDYGANISLSADEYERYQNIVQQILGISPSLVSGYDNEGKAIANKNGLIERSIALLKEENRQRLETATSEDTLKTIGMGKVQEIKDFVSDNVFPYGDAKSRFTSTFEKAANRYAELEQGNYEGEIYDLLHPDDRDLNDFWSRDYWSEYGDNASSFASDFYDQIVADLKSGRSKLSKFFTRSEIKELIEIANEYDRNVALYNSRMEQYQTALNPSLQLVPQTLTVYDGLTDAQKNFVSQYINTFRITANTTEADIEKMRQNILNFTEDIGNAAPETKKAIENLFSLDKVKISAAEWENRANELINQVVNSLNFDSEEDKNSFVKQIKISLGFEFTTDGETSVGVMLEGVKDKIEDEFDDKVNNLGFNELQIAYKIASEIPDGTLLAWGEFKEKLDAATQSSDDLTVSLTELEKVSNNIKPLGAAFKELADDGYITIKTLSEIKAASDLSGEEWAMYEAKLLNAKVGSSEFNQVMSDLTYRILDNTFATADLNTLTEQQVAATLRENGVVNASAVAHQWLAIAKAKSALAAFDFAEAEQKDIDKLKESLRLLGLNETAIEKLTKTYATAQSTMLKIVDEGVKTRLKLNEAELLGIQSVAEAYARLANKGYDYDGDGIIDITDEEYQKGDYDPNSPAFKQYKADREMLAALGAAREEINNIINSIDTPPIEVDPDYSGAAKDKSSKSDKNEALDNYLKDAENRYKVHQDETRYIQDLQYAYDNLTKTDKERLDITGKINEAYRDLAGNRIKDIEHQIELAKELNEYADVTDYYKQIQKIAHEEAERLRKPLYDKNGKLIREGYDDNSNEIQELQKTWWDAQNKIADESYSKSERWINERNTYNDWDLYGDNEIAAWERVLYRFKAEFPKELETIKDIEQKIFEARKDAMEKLIDDIESYIDARNTYNDWDAYGDSEVNAIQRESKIIEVAYTNRLLSYEEYVDRLEELSQRVYSLGQERVEKHLSNLDRYINARNHYNDWDAFNDSEIEAIKRQCKILDEAYRSNLISYEEYVKKTEEYTQRLYSVAKENIIEEISKLIEDYEEKNQLESSQLESQKTLLQSYYDVTNSIAEAQHEINKELKASMTMYEYLNEETRKLLFNQEDYEALTKELLDIQSAADALQKQYQEDILNANAETIAEITSQYQMQYETMMKQYEIAKAELEVAKKRQQLDNVLAERNTRMFINGQWQWVANTQDVINAQNELAEAEIERKKKEASLEQTEAINDFTEKINSLETDLNKVREYWSNMQEMLNGEADDVAKALKEISEVSSPELKKVIDATGGTITSFSTTLSESTTTLSDIVSGDRGLGTVSTNIDTIITDLENYSDAIQNLTNKINGVSTDNNKKGNSSSVDAIIAQMQANSIKWHVATELEKEALHKENLQLGASIGATYDSTTGQWTYPEVKSSPSSGSTSSSKGSSGGLPSGSSGGKTVQVGSNGNAPSGTKVGDTVVTAGGSYLVVPKDTPGSTYNPASGLSSIKIEEKNADGTRYTSGGMTLMGEEGFETFITNSGRLIPITKPTIGNIGAGGIVFNREQMANLRNLWDWSNVGKVSPFVSSSNANTQSTVIDNSIHINGLTVAEQGNEDWINGLRRYVATHK